MVLRVCRHTLGNGGDEPVPFVVAAEELALALALTNQEQQVTVGWLYVEDGNLGLGIPSPSDLEELAFATMPRTLSRPPSSSWRAKAPLFVPTPLWPRASAAA
jgi:hypothetical protein